MSLVNAKCTNCGSTLEVDNSLDAYICSHCGSAFIVEKAIQNFNNTYITNNNIKADVVNIYNNQESDFVIEKGVLTEYKGSDEIVTIPNKVKEIGDRAFSDSKYLKQVTIPSSVEVIGEYAFSSCPNLKTIDFGNGLKQIKKNAFHGSKIEELHLPTGNYRVEEHAFESCEIKNFFVPKNVTFGHSVLFQGSVENVEFEEGIEIIPENLFSFCKKVPLRNLPSSVQVIEKNAFSYSGIISITLQKPLKWVDYTAFKKSELREVVLKDLGKINYKKSIDKNNTEDVQFCKDAFSDCLFLKTVKLINTETKKCIACGLPILFSRCVCGVKYKKEEK